jgi:hypothetical protein
MTGEDETAQMLMDAKDRVEALEGKLKGLKAAGDQQAASAQKQSTAMGAVNSRMVSVATSAKGAIEGFDKTAGAIGKVTATLGFWGAAITGAVALGAELIGMLSATSGEVARLEGELAASKKGADEFATSMREMTTAIAAAQISSNNLATSTATLRSKMAALRGDLVGAEFERRQAEQLALAGQILDTETKMAESRSAQTKAMEQAAKAQAQVEEGAKKEAALRQDIQKAELDRKLGIKTEDTEILHLKSLQLQQTIGENKENRNILAGAERRTKELDTQVESLVEQKNLMRDIMGLMQGQKFEVPGATDPDKPPKPTGGSGGGTKKETEREKRDRELRQEKERRQQEIRMNREFTAQVLENARIRDERLEAEAKAQKEAAEARKKLAQEQAAAERMSDAQPVMDFANALTSNLVPALSEVQGLMDEVTSIFEKFTDGQTSMTQALGQGAMEIAAFAAKSIGGVKAEAAVRAIYEGAMGFATLATPAISAGHFTAAAMLAGVATGVIGGGGASASASASKGMGKPSTSPSGNGGGGNNGGPVTNVYNLTAGVIDGQSTTRAFRRAELQSRGSGFATAGGW